MREFYYDDSKFGSKKFAEENFEDLVGSVIRKKHQNLPMTDFNDLLQFQKESQKSQKIFANKYSKELYRVRC